MGQADKLMALNLIQGFVKTVQTLSSQTTAGRTKTEIHPSRVVALVAEVLHIITCPLKKVIQIGTMITIGVFNVAVNAAPACQ